MTPRVQLAKAKSDAARELLLRDFPGPVTLELVYQLCEEVGRQMRVDLVAAAGYADAAYAIARRLADKRALAEALRMKGHVAYLAGRYRQAAGSYRRAIRTLEELGNHVDVARTLSSALQTLIYLGRYDEALEWAERARGIFEHEQDRLRLARLDSNIGNILHRQDRYEEALELYRRAITGLRECKDQESAAIALRNMAVCHTAVHDFDRALRAYEEARSYYGEKGPKLLAAEVNDNIANLYHMRGEYTRAIALYQSSDVDERGNTYHVAVAKLDQSDLYLELNSFTEAARFAEDAAGRFARLGMRYEQAKSIVNLALASFRSGDSDRTLPLLGRARSLFRREKNAGWEAATDLYRAVVLLEFGQIEEAREAALQSQCRLVSSSMFEQSILCSLLLARLELLTGNTTEARRYCVQAHGDGSRACTLVLSFQLHMVSGQVFEAEGDPDAAWREYREAHRISEMLRGQFRNDQLKIAFVRDKQLVYENLVRLAATGAVDVQMEELLRYVEQAKSRSLGESMILGARSRHAFAGENFSESENVSAVRRELSWYYRQLDRTESAKGNPASHRIDQLRERIAACEERLTSALTTRNGDTQAFVPDGHATTLVSIQAVLSGETALLEYFVTGGRLYLFVVTATQVHPVLLGDFEEVQMTCRLLRFQMSRGASGPARPAPNDAARLAATQMHLQSLYRILIEPAHPWLPEGHWVVVPHGPLHRLPFHALHDGESYLIDQRTFSYAPSATVYQRCVERQPAWTGDSAVFGVPDERAPYILREVECVAGLLPRARIFLGSDATAECLRTMAVRSRFIHLATHGVFRQDNPLFSSIRMGDSRLCLLDLYDFELAAELVTLSGCATGVYEAVGADEVIGLARGLLHAGAHAVHLSLWEVNDRSTSEYMSCFYSKLQSGCDMAEALRAAMLETRDRYAHPYFWAPFALTGRARSVTQPLFPAGGGDPIARERS